jgi:hypothetical protein
MVTASVLGLFHGFGINLIMTISLIQGDWPGRMEWCGASAIVHKYIVYSMIYCQVVLCLEVRRCLMTMMINIVLGGFVTIYSVY